MVRSPSLLSLAISARIDPANLGLQLRVFAEPIDLAASLIITRPPEFHTKRTSTRLGTEFNEVAIVDGRMTSRV